MKYYEFCLVSEIIIKFDFKWVDAIVSLSSSSSETQVVVCVTAGVGKSCTVMQFVEHKMNHHHDVTIGV